MEITPEIVAAFRAYYPEFESAERYLDRDVIQSLEEGSGETGSRWGKYVVRSVPISIKRRGLFAYAAHRLAMRGLQSTITTGGGLAGVAYPVTSKSVGDESTSYAVPGQSLDGMLANGDLTMTAYGMEFLRLRKRAATGPMMV